MTEILDKNPEIELVAASVESLEHLTQFAMQDVPRPGEERPMPTIIKRENMVGVSVGLHIPYISWRTFEHMRSIAVSSEILTYVATDIEGNNGHPLVIKRSS